jgi:hypothetical protein
LRRPALPTNRDRAARLPGRLAALVLGAAVLRAPVARSAEPEGNDAATTEKTETTEDTRPHLGPFELSGDLSQKYRFRTTSSQSDQDVYGYLNIDGQLSADGPEARRPYSSLSFNLQASYNLDIDSSNQSSIEGGSFFPFFDITNTYQDRFHAWLYSAYFQAADLGPFETARVGRQEITREYGILFDGGHLRTQRWNTLSFDVYGGLPAHLYETPRGDAFGGVSVDSEIASGLVIGADYYYIRDERDAGLPDSHDHVYLGRATWRPNNEWRIDGSASWVDTRDRLQQLTSSYNSQDWGFSGTFRAARQNGVVDFQSSEISPFVFIEGSYAPYYQLTLDLHQPIAERFGVGGGFDIRQLEDASDEGLYNHSFRNFYIQADASQLWPGSKLSARVDYWNSVGGDDIESFGVELEQKVLDFLRVRVGTSYSLYRIDLFTGLEKERDRSYYAKLRWRLWRGLDLDTDYQYEKDSITEYHTLTVGLRKWF